MIYEYNERNDMFLFENDYSNLIYDTDEGKAVLALLDSDEEDRTIRKESVTPKQLEDAFQAYWNARNDTEIFHISGVPKAYRELVA